MSSSVRRDVSCDCRVRRFLRRDRISGSDSGLLVLLFREGLLGDFEMAGLWR